MAEDSNTTYGFIGLGNMGYGMAKSLRANIPPSASLVVCEINKERLADFMSRTQGSIEAVSSPREVCERAKVIVTMLPNGDAVRKVFLDAETGLLAGTQNVESRFFLECSTIEVATSREVLQRIKSTGRDYFVDAPVSGGIPAANSGELTFMVGGSEPLFAKAKSLLTTMGDPEKIIYCGEAGAGLASKQINNYIGYASYIALCEGMNAGIRFGLDPKILTDVINVSSGMCWNSLNMSPVKGVQPNSSASRDFKPGFTTELAKGVIDMTVSLMDEVGAKHVLAEVVQDVYARAVKNPKCAGLESRSTWRLVAEDDGKDLGKTVIQ